MTSCTSPCGHLYLFHRVDASWPVCPTWISLLSSIQHGQNGAIHTPNASLLFLWKPRGNACVTSITFSRPLKFKPTFESDVPSAVWATRKALLSRPQFSPPVKGEGKTRGILRTLPGFTMENVSDFKPTLKKKKKVWKQMVDF